MQSIYCTCYMINSTGYGGNKTACTILYTLKIFNVNSWYFKKQTITVIYMRPIIMF